MKTEDVTISTMLVSSGFSFEGYRIVKYSEFISSDEVTRFPTSDIYNYKDQYAQNLTKPLVETRKKAIDKLKNDAAALGCNALIGVSYNYYHFENVAQDHGFAVQPFHFICITASGTAVVIEKE